MEKELVHKVGSLCRDNGSLCVLVKVESVPETTASKLMDQAGIFVPLGHFVDLENLEFGWVSGYPNEHHSGSWVVSTFSRNLDVVEWL